MLFLISTGVIYHRDVYSYFLVHLVIIVRSDQGGCQFCSCENTSFHITLAFDDRKHFHAHNGKNHKSYKSLSMSDFIGHYVCLHLQPGTHALLRPISMPKIWLSPALLILLSSINSPHKTTHCHYKYVCQDIS